MEEETTTTTTLSTEQPVNGPVDPTMPAGVPHGTVLETENGQEKVVHDLDADGNVIGWHKEAVTEEAA